jgi:hypothetical protein
MSLSLDGTTGISASGNITGGNVIASGSLIVSNFAPASLSTVGNVQGGNLITTGTISVTGNIVTTGSNAVANIGSATTYFNTAHVKATSAQYADVAEVYQSDIRYASGTVVEFGGSKEVTISRTSHSTRVAGIVSTNPAYLMNAGQLSDTSIQLALIGRVPCQVTGQIRKGDQLVSSDIPGVAKVMNSAEYQPGCVIGKALENHESNDVGVIEVVVGRV